MGDYTELVLAIELKWDTPPEVINILEYLANYVAIASSTDEEPAVNSDHPLFKTTRWHGLLCSNSYYFDGITHSRLKYDQITKTYFLTIRSNLKNYEEEIQKFLHWLAPYSQSGSEKKGPKDLYPTPKGRTFVGYFLFEYNNEPTLIYFSDGKAYLSKSNPSKLEEIVY